MRCCETRGLGLHWTEPSCGATEIESSAAWLDVWIRGSKSQNFEWTMKKRAPSCLGYMLWMNSYTGIRYMGIIFINHCRDSLLNNQYFMESIGPFFFFFYVAQVAAGFRGEEAVPSALGTAVTNGFFDRIWNLAISFFCRLPQVISY